MEKTWDVRPRTMAFAVAVFKFARTVPRTDEARDIVRQLRRASSAVAANCRAMKRASTDPIFVAKAAQVVEEADESGFWLEFLVEVELTRRNTVEALTKEANEPVAIFVAIRKNTEARMEREAAAKRQKTTSPTAR